MTEGLATMNGVPTPELERLYGKWSDGGAGLLIDFIYLVLNGALDWVPAEDQLALGRRLRETNNINPPQDCNTCHR